MVIPIVAPVIHLFIHGRILAVKDKSECIFLASTYYFRSGILSAIYQRVQWLNKSPTLLNHDILGHPRRTLGLDIKRHKGSWHNQRWSRSYNVPAPSCQGLSGKASWRNLNPSRAPFFLLPTFLLSPKLQVVGQGLLLLVLVGSLLFLLLFSGFLTLRIE